jgi:uncharacterized protein
MPHARNRLLQARIEKTLKHSPIVGILGQRQTGKTTLMESLVPTDHYVTLDKAMQLSAARTNPEAFLERGTALFGIDECQFAPELFPALKERVRLQKRPGQYLLTGSVRFTSRKLIRESLTGRIVSHELLPLCLAEMHEFEIGNAVKLLRLSLPRLQKAVKERLHVISEKIAGDYLEKGGLPGICFFREKAVRDERMSAHIETLLRRDIRLVFETTLPVEKLWMALRFIAMNQGKPLTLSTLSRESRISLPALLRLIPAFEALFLIRRVSTLGDRKKDRFFLEDQGMATFLHPGRSSALDGEFDLLRLVYSQCLAQMKYLYSGHESIQSFETRGGATVPLVLDVNGEKTGLVIVPGEAPDVKAIAAAESFIGRFPRAVVGILTRGRDVSSLAPGIRVLPYRAVI